MFEAAATRTYVLVLKRNKMPRPSIPPRGFPGKQQWSLECPGQHDFTWIRFFHLNAFDFPPCYTFLSVAAAAAAARSTKVNPSAINPGSIQPGWSSMPEFFPVSPGWIDREQAKSVVCPSSSYFTIFVWTIESKLHLRAAWSPRLRLRRSASLKISALMSHFSPKRINELARVTITSFVLDASLGLIKRLSSILLHNHLHCLLPWRQYSKRAKCWSLTPISETKTTRKWGDMFSCVLLSSFSINNPC